MYLDGDSEQDDMEDEENAPSLDERQNRTDSPADGEDLQQILSPDLAREQNRPGTHDKHQRRGKSCPHAPEASSQPIDTGNSQHTEQARE